MQIMKNKSVLKITSLLLVTASFTIMRSACTLDQSFAQTSTGKSDLILGSFPCDLAKPVIDGCDFSNLNLAHSNLSGHVLNNVNFTGANLDSVDFSSAVLTNVNFTNASLKNDNLRWAELSGSNFTNAILDGAHLFGAFGSGITLLGTSLLGAESCTGVGPSYCPSTLPLFGGNFVGDNLQGFDFSNFPNPGQNFSQANLTNATLVSKNLAGATFSNSNLSNADLHLSNLSSASLAGANLAGANLAGVNLRGADLSNSNLTGADLSNSNLTGAVLTGAIFLGSNLSSAILPGANLAGFNLSNANLTSANLSGANISSTNFDGANLQNTTIDGAYFYPLPIGQVQGNPRFLPCGLKVINGIFSGAMCQVDLLNATQYPLSPWRKVGVPGEIRNSESPQVTLSYQWVVLAVGWNIESEIPGATGSTYVPTPEQLGKTIACRVTRARPGYLDAVFIIAPATVQEGDLPSYSPSLTGDPRVGKTLSIQPTAWGPDISVTYQWYRDLVAIPSATSANYVVTRADAGHDIVLTVSGTRPGYLQATYSTYAFIQPDNLALTPAPALVGSPKVGEPISVKTGIWDTGVTLAYQWLLDGSPIFGADSSAYIPQPLDGGHRLSVSVTGSAIGFNPSTQTSPALSVDLGLLGQQPVPLVAGLYRLGSALSAAPGDWGQNVSLGFKWLRDGTPIPGATSSTYYLQVPDVGHQVAVAVTGTAVGFSPTTQTSQAGMVLPGFLASTPIPSITGGPKVGSILLSNSMSWDSGVSLSYQWLRDGIPISGATALSYEPTSLDYSHQLSVSVTGSAAGYTSSTQTSSVVTIGLGSLSSAPVPSITGNAVVGATLSASPGAWDSGVSLAYQWLRDGAPIFGENTPSYRLRVADLGQNISVSVSGSLIGYSVTTQTSDVRKVALGSLISRPIPTIFGPLSVGSVLSAVPGVWDSGVSLAYQWLRDASPINGATSDSYQLVGDDFSHQVSISVTGFSPGYASATQTSLASNVTLGTLGKSPIPGLSGLGVVGKILSAIAGVWDSGASLFYQWLRDGVPISGATADSYTLAASDYGHQVSVSVTGSVIGYAPSTQTSAAIDVDKGTLSSTPIPSVSGSAAVSSTLTAIPGVWDSGVTLTYQWLLDGSPINGATLPIYQLIPSNLGRQVSVEVTGSALGYKSATMASGSTTVAAHALTLTPVPAITGQAKFGGTLASNAGTWDAGVSLSFQWLRDGSPIRGAGSSSYNVQLSDFGHWLSVQVTGTAEGFASASQVSQNLAVLPSSMTSTPTPKVEGDLRVGSTLKAASGIWDSGVALSYQWLRDGAAIVGATAATYQLTASDYSHQVSVSVTGSATGYTSSTQTSSALTIGLGSLAKTPVPLVSGSSAVSSTLTVDPGIWDSGVTLGYQWLRDGLPIVGATGPTYQLDAADLGRLVSVQVSGVANGFSSVVKVSLPVEVAAHVMTLTPTPIVAGTARVGATLTVNPGLWDSGVSLTYQWLRDGLPIAGQTSNSYQVQAADLGHSVSAQVAGGAIGYATVNLASTPQVVQAGQLAVLKLSVSGKYLVGQTLTTKISGLTVGSKVSYQWFLDGKKISGAIASKLKISKLYAKHKLSVKVTEKLDGFADLVASSSSMKVS